MPDPKYPPPIAPPQAARGRRRGPDGTDHVPRGTRGATQRRRGSGPRAVPGSKTDQRLPWDGGGLGAGRGGVGLPA